MNAYGSGLTDVGRRRASNQDAFALDNSIGLFVVADGMGGHAGGEVASRESVATILGHVKRQSGLLKALDGPEVTSEQMRAAVRLLEASLQAATYFVYAMAETQPEQKGMGTTVSALILRGDRAITAQVGDSRIYLIRGGQAAQLTEDHTLIQWQLKNGMITEEEAERSPHKNVITRAVGSKDYVEVDTRVIDTCENDAFLICSDGLHGYLEEDEIAGYLEYDDDEALQRLIDVANDRGGKDNITAVIARVLP